MLRSLSAKDREIHTSATEQAPAVASPVARWWFQDGNKEKVDEMLGDEDKADTAENEADHIRHKCE